MTDNGDRQVSSALAMTDNGDRQVSSALAMTDKGMPHHISLVSTEIREVPTLSAVRLALQEYGKANPANSKYKMFHSVCLRKIGSQNQIDMELDVVLEHGTEHYIFETKIGKYLGIGKWIDRARLFGEDRFITCVRDENLPKEYFRPFMLWHLQKLKDEMIKLLSEHDGIKSGKDGNETRQA